MLAAIKNRFAPHQETDKGLRAPLLSAKKNYSASIHDANNVPATETVKVKCDAKLATKAEKTLAPLSLTQAFSISIERATTKRACEDLIKIRQAFLDTCKRVMDGGEIMIAPDDGHVGKAFLMLTNSLKIKDLDRDIIHYAGFFEALNIINKLNYDGSKTKATDLLIENIFKVKFPLKAVQAISRVLVDSILTLKDSSHKVYFLGKFAQAVKINAGLEEKEIASVLSSIKTQVAQTKDQDLIGAYSAALKVRN